MRIILGPPGTGKTTYLLDKVDEYLQAGVPPDRIGYFSFTRKAAREAVDRACQKFLLSHRDLPYFRTLHSLAYMQMGVNRDDLLTPDQIDEFADLCRIPKGQLVKINRQFLTGLDQEVTYDREACLDVIQYARIMRLPLSMAYKMSKLPLTMDYSAFLRIEDAYRRWRRQEEKYDYTDLLEQFVEHGLAPRLEVLFVDEAQDLSPIQWAMVDVLVAHSRFTYVAGDDDQAIYRWAGADVNHFINLEGEVTVLTQSHRIPRSHHRISQNIIHGVKNRRTKEFNPRDEEGLVEYCNHHEEVDLNEGTWLILAREGKDLHLIQKGIERRGLLYGIQGSHAGRFKEMLDAIRAWEQLCAGRSIYTSEINNLYAYMGKSGVLYGHKSKYRIVEPGWADMERMRQEFGLVAEGPWERVLEKIPTPHRDYMRRARKMGEDLLGEPRIQISTIHGAKGGEADNVLLINELLPKRIQREIGTQQELEDERRVWYVGTTRAKKRLVIQHPSKTTGFPLVAPRTTTSKKEQK